MRARRKVSQQRPASLSIQRHVQLLIPGAFHLEPETEHRPRRHRGRGPAIESVILKAEQNPAITVFFAENLVIVTGRSSPIHIHHRHQGQPRGRLK